jgi:hypothetical protein
MEAMRSEPECTDEEIANGVLKNKGSDGPPSLKATSTSSPLIVGV